MEKLYDPYLQIQVFADNCRTHLSPDPRYEFVESNHAHGKWFLRDLTTGETLRIAELEDIGLRHRLDEVLGGVMLFNDWQARCQFVHDTFAPLSVDVPPTMMAEMADDYGAHLVDVTRIRLRVEGYTEDEIDRAFILMDKEIPREYYTGTHVRLNEADIISF